MNIKYELMLILNSKITPKDQNDILDDIKKNLGTGKITEVKDWGKRILAYPIKKEKEGNYLLLMLEMGGQEAVKLSGSLRKNETILRCLLVRRE